MPPRSLLLAAATVAALVTVPATALAIPPANDNYLASTAINEAGAAVPPEYQDTVDTTEATTQADLFNPSRTGQPLGGDGPENTQCRATGFGRTVWYDFHTPTPGGIELNTSGFDAVITVYQWNDANAKIVRTVNCQDTAGPTERFDVFRLKRNKAYTIQVGGVSGPAGIAGGPLTFHLDWFADTDGDGFFDDEGDRCPETPGLRRFGGCPPELNISPSLNFDDAPGGIKINRLVVARVPKGAKVVGTCGGCPRQTIKAKRAGRVSLSKLVGRTVKGGSKVQIRVTMKATGKGGKYKFGATGKLITWPVLIGGIGTKKERCLHVGTGKAESCS